MAKKVPTSGRFKKGQTGNPGGSSKKQRELSQDTSELQKAGRKQLVIAGDEILFGSSIDELHLIADDRQKVCSAKVVLAKLVLKAWVDGDHKPLAMALDYCIGKPKEMQAIEITGKDGGPVQSANTVAGMTVAEMQAELAAIRARRKAAEK